MLDGDAFTSRVGGMVGSKGDIEESASCVGGEQ